MIPRPARLGLALAAVLLVPAVDLDGCQVEAVTAGMRHTMVLRSDGTVWVYGDTRSRGNDWWPDDRLLPTRVADIDDAVAVAGAFLVLRSDGTVWTWRNGPPEPVPGITDATAVAKGAEFGMALRGDGTVLAWGSNASGQLGDGTGRDSQAPVPVAGLSGATAISAGERHALALLADGTIMAWGAGQAGQLGNGGYVDRDSPTEVAGIGTAVAIAAGSHHSLAALADGTVVAWGFNESGEVPGVPVGNPIATPFEVAGIDGVVEVAAGWGHSLALRDDATVWAWGSNAYANLGTPTTAATSAPIPLGGISGAVAIAAGPYHSAAVLDDASVVVWGANWEGQVAVPPDTLRHEPAEILSGAAGIEASRDHQSFALRPDGSLRAWGDNDRGELGTGGVGNAVPLPLPVPIGGTVRGVSSGYAHTLALMEDGTVMAWGDNAYGQIGPNGGSGSPAPVTVPLPGPASGVEAGWDHSLALLEDGTLWSWGADDLGQLGDDPVAMSSPDPRQVPGLGVVTQVAAGALHTLALRQDGTLFTWGANGAGQLGDGTFDVAMTPRQVTGLPGPVVSVAAGAEHSLARLATGSIWAWGSNRVGQVGTSEAGGSFNAPVAADRVGSFQAVGAGGETSLGVTAAGQLQVWGRHLSAAAPEPIGPVTIELPGPVDEAAAGAAHVLALLRDGRVFGWGENWTGQLGLGTADRVWDPISSGFEGPTRDLGAMLRMRRSVEGRVFATWHLSHDAVLYNLHRDEAPDFSGSDLVGSTPATELEDPAPAGGLLYYRVRGEDCAGEEGP